MFFAAVTLLVLLVQHSLEDDGTATPSTVAAPAPPTASTAAAAQPKPAKRYYRVQPGDTLESIAGKYNTTVPDLLTLNPNIDPLALTPGERIRVR